MKYECANCGIPVRFYEPGRLFLKKEGEAAWSSFDYGHINEASTLLKTSGAKMAGIGKKGARLPERSASFEEIVYLFEQKEAVELIESGDLISYLQPIVDLRNDSIYGYESLLRTPASDTQISPGILFSTAAKTGLHSRLDQRAREAAIKARKEQVTGNIKSFINFLPSTIYNPEFCLRHTFQLVEKYEIDPSNLVFEVVETEKIIDVSHLKNVFSVYQREGMKVALDDVGAGFSTLDMLSTLRPDYVKIDRSYVSYCDQNKENQSFLNEAMHIASSLGITLLAEGIERQEELDYCLAAGIPLAQGYLIGKPAPEAVIPEGFSLS
jgi:EAL domain-containing protein (putative c-di-GMP-specific phosphodiesterase class I)